MSNRYIRVPLSTGLPLQVPRVLERADVQFLDCIVSFEKTADGVAILLRRRPTSFREKPRDLLGSLAAEGHCVVVERRTQPDTNLEAQLLERAAVELLPEPLPHEISP